MNTGQSKTSKNKNNFNLHNTMSSSYKEMKKNSKGDPEIVVDNETRGYEVSRQP